ncbi:MAG: hypothetical protein AAF605_09090 [Myxococcota bacterium]
MFLRNTLAIIVVALAFGACSDDADESTDATENTNESIDDTPATIELSPTLCDHPNNLQMVLDSIGANDLSEVDFGLGGTNIDELNLLFANPTQPFYMVNLIKFREMAEYADGRETELTGREANAVYNPVPFITAIGGQVVYSAEVDQQFAGEVVWENVALVRYSCPIAILAMTQDPGFQDTLIHKDAGVEITRVMPSTLRMIPAPADPDQSEAAFPPTDVDPAFDFVRVTKFRDTALYDVGVNEPERTGEEAWELYASAEAAAATDLGHYPLAVFDVIATLSGESVGWDRVEIVRMSSQAGYQALLDDGDRTAAEFHRDAALEGNDEVSGFALLSAFDDSAGGGGTGLGEVTENGTGTPCTADSDCPDSSFVCISDGSSTGFCSPEGCTTGTCEGMYVCCGDCNPAAASQLPFDGSACLPTAAATTLTNPPLSCTCD